MYFVPFGLLVKHFADASFWTQTGREAASYDNLTASSIFSDNLLPVTIGNVIGGALMVGIVYWFIYLRRSR